MCQEYTKYTGSRLQRAWLQRTPCSNEQISLHQNHWSFGYPLITSSLVCIFLVVVRGIQCIFPNSLLWIKGCYPSGKSQVGERLGGGRFSVGQGMMLESVMEFNKFIQQIQWMQNGIYRRVVDKSGNPCVTFIECFVHLPQVSWTHVLISNSWQAWLGIVDQNWLKLALAKLALGQSISLKVVGMPTPVITTVRSKFPFICMKYLTNPANSTGNPIP